MLGNLSEGEIVPNCTECKYILFGLGRKKSGYCRRFPPVFDPNFDRELKGQDAGLPYVSHLDWCGEFQQKEGDK